MQPWQRSINPDALRGARTRCVYHAWHDAAWLPCVSLVLAATAAPFRLWRAMLCTPQWPQSRPASSSCSACARQQRRRRACPIFLASPGPRRFCRALSPCAHAAAALRGCCWLLLGLTPGCAYQPGRLRRRAQERVKPLLEGTGARLHITRSEQEIPAPLGHEHHP